MNFFAVTLLTIVSGLIAYGLCFTDTTFGGYLPCALITIGPLIGYICGLLERTTGSN